MTAKLGNIPTRLIQEGALVEGLWAGGLGSDTLPVVPGRGRIRRWHYAAMATTDGDLALGAAVVDLGIGGTAFVWLAEDGVVVERTRKIFRPSHKSIGDGPGLLAHGEATGIRVDVSANSLDVRVDDLGGRSMTASLAWDAVAPVVCSTSTSGGGLNVTQKTAGHEVHGTLDRGGEARQVTGHGWSDWTHGRQDRRTAWRWAAGAGRAQDGRPIGLNLSTGMNNEAHGENVAWIGGVPMGLRVDELGPVSAGDFSGPWRMAGPGWSLGFTPTGLRSANENLLLVKSRYVQPVGRFTGTLPTPEGGTLNVSFTGVTEDHEAVW